MIAGDHVILRAFEVGDADRCYRWMNDPNIVRYKLRINVFDYNDRATHLLLSVGFVQEGKLVNDFYREGAYHDLLILSIFRDSKPPAQVVP
jgi:hypothetical protein